MSAVLLATTGDNAQVAHSCDDYLRVQESARSDRYGIHRLVDTPQEADIILFVGARESDFWDVRRHPWVRAHPEKCFLYHSEDLVFPFLPGIYPSLRPRDGRFGRACSGAYAAVLHIDIPHLPFNPRARYLFSFRGSFRTCPQLRGRLGVLESDPRGLVEDTSGAHAAAAPHAPGAHRQGFIDLLGDTKFSLCPRGRGSSSWRLFESLRAGRAPVIVSDEWVPPAMVPDWDAFSIRVAERDVRHIPALLREREGAAAAMAAAARHAWDEWFAMEAFFHWSVESCLRLRARRALQERHARRLLWLPLAHPVNFRRFVVPRLRKLLRGGASAAGTPA